MGHSVCRHSGQGHGFQPAQDAQFGFRVSEPVEDHNPQQGFDIQLPLTGAEHARQAIKAQFFPERCKAPFNVSLCSRFVFTSEKTDVCTILRGAGAWAVPE